MYIDINKPIATNRYEICRIYDYYNNATQGDLINNPDDNYGVDRLSALQYLQTFPKWQTKLFAFFSDLEKQNKKFSYIDICGRASGCKNFGASVSYLFSLKTDKWTRSLRCSNDIFVDGSIFDCRDFSRLIYHVKHGGIKPALITCMPMAGLHSYTPKTSINDMPNYEAITYIVLAKRLAKLIDLLHPGGFIMIERPFQFDGSFIEAFDRIPQNKFKLSMALKKFARKMKCKIEIISDIGGPYFLIQKPI